MIRLLKDFFAEIRGSVRIYSCLQETQANLIWPPPVEHVPSAVFDEIGLWHSSYAVLSTFQNRQAIERNALVRGFSAAWCRGNSRSKGKKKALTRFL